MYYKKFGEMSRGAQVALFEDMLDGKPIQYSHDLQEWSITRTPRWDDGLYYRAEPIPLTKPSLNWDHASPDLVALATDSSGRSYLYVERIPERGVGGFLPMSGGCANAVSFASFKKGTCAWKDSLVYRPGHEPK